MLKEVIIIQNKRNMKTMGRSQPICDRPFPFLWFHVSFIYFDKRNTKNKILKKRNKRKIEHDIKETCILFL